MSYNKINTELESRTYFISWQTPIDKSLQVGYKSINS